MLFLTNAVNKPYGNIYTSDEFKDKLKIILTNHKRHEVPIIGTTNSSVC